MATFILFVLAILAVFALPNINADYVLYNGEVLMAGQNLTNGEFYLSMQTDCNLVLYHNGNPLWKANITAQQGGGQDQTCYLGLKQTGELVIRRDIHYTLWSSGARSKRGKYALALHDDGTLHVYGNRRWTTNNQKEAWRPELSFLPVSTDYTLSNSQRLTLGRKLVYRDYELVLDRCNLVINNTMTRKILWQTNTKSNGCYLQLENNGELVLKHVNQRIWSSNKRSDSGRYLAVLRFDGRLAVYGPLLWSNSLIGYNDHGEHKFSDVGGESVQKI